MSPKLSPVALFTSWAPVSGCATACMTCCMSATWALVCGLMSVDFSPSP